MDSFDVAVIGAGAAGISAAKLACSAGKRVVLTEQGRVGGDTIWTGSVPSKALIEAARVRHEVGRAAQFGVLTDRATVNFPAVMAYIRNLIDTLAGFQDADHLESLGIALRFGKARLADRRTLTIERERIQARKIIICTGARPAVPAVSGLDDVPYMTTRTLFDLERLPAHLIIVGGGTTGLEMAQAFRRLGSRVTVIEQSPRLLPDSDGDVTDVLRAILQREGIEILLGMRVERPQYRDGVYRVTATREDRYLIVEGDALLVATGISPNIGGLGLEAAGVSVGQRGITVDERLQTSVDGIFAAGDVTGMYGYTHVATYQARIAAGNAVGKSAKADYRTVPKVLFIDPPMASAGLTESEARRNQTTIQTAFLPFTAIDRAVVERRLQGVIKVVLGKKPGLSRRASGEILGAHLLGEGADDLVHEFVAAMQSRMLGPRLAQTIHAYPTMSGGVQSVMRLLFPSTQGSVSLREELALDR